MGLNRSLLCPHVERELSKCAEHITAELTLHLCGHMTSRCQPRPVNPPRMNCRQATLSTSTWMRLNSSKQAQAPACDGESLDLLCVGSHIPINYIKNINRLNQLNQLKIPMVPNKWLGDAGWLHPPAKMGTPTHWGGTFPSSYWPVPSH